MDLKTDPEFKDLLPPLDSREYAQLEKNLMVNGCPDPISVWGNVIIDGHNRYNLCKKHNIHFDVRHLNFKDKGEAVDWILTNQIGRRNLSPDDFRLLLGRLYNRAKKGDGQRGPKKLDQNEQAFKSTAKALAEKHDVSPATVRRAGKFTETVDQIQKEKPEIAEQGKEVVIKKAKEMMKAKPKPQKKEMEPEIKENPCDEEAMRYARMAVADLEQIHHNHHDRDEAFDYVLKWINQNR